MASRLSAFLFGLVSLLCLSGSASRQQEQVCDCDFTVPLKMKYLDNFRLQLPEGSVICITAGVRDHLVFENFRTNDSTRRFVFKNCGGQAIVHSTDKGSGINFKNCKNFQVTGTGSSDVVYGFHIQGSLKADSSRYIPNWGLVCGERSTDFEIDHVKVTKIHFAAFGLKTDPDCIDSSAWRGNFTMQNISVHHNLVDTTGTGEGFYIGYSFYAGKVKCTYAKPHDIKSIRVFSNKVYNTGADGLQVGCAVSDCEIYDNHIENYGINPFNGSTSQQGNGIQLGDGTSGLCYNNYISAKPGAITGGGIKVFGINNTVFNNVLVNPHELGIFVDERSGSDTAQDSGYRIYNNTIINPGGHGIWLMSEKVSNNWVRNNIIIKSAGKGAFIFADSTVRLDTTHNFLSRSIAKAGFVNAAKNNYRLTAKSACLNKGMNLFSEGVKFDFDHKPRSTSKRFEQGAFEYTGPQQP
jgi:hypothetical protein